MTVSPEDNAAPDLGQYRSYLKLLADLQLNPRLKVKEDASDIVQQIMLEAHRDFADFRGKTEAVLRAWLKTILTHNLLTVAKHYGRDKRAAGCIKSAFWLTCSRLPGQSTTRAQSMWQRRLQGKIDKMNNRLIVTSREENVR